MSSQSSNAGTMLFTFYGGPGATYPSGEITGSGNQQRLVDFGYAAGLMISYLFLDSGGLFVGSEYVHESFSIKRSLTANKMSNKLDFSFINAFLGYKFFFKYAYIDLGVYYGANIATWKEETKFLGLKTTVNIPGNFKHDVVGLMVGAGGRIPVTKFMSIDIGVRLLVSFIPAFKYMDKIIPNMGMITAGMTFNVPLTPQKKG